MFDTDSTVTLELTRPKRTKTKQWIMLGAAIGPGIMVMLADTDAGSVITAAQSGAVYGYRLILPQILLIPILYFVQEITIRLGIITRKGHGELIREHFGVGFAMISVITLFLAAIGALVTEFSGIAGVGELFGLPPSLTVSMATLLLIVIGLSGSYRRVERIGVAIGLLELLFIPTAFLSHPHPLDMLASFQSQPLADPHYLYLLAANIGAVIMPWMIFYQQGAVIDKGLRKRNLKASRLDTLIGSFATQIIMIAVIITVAATIGQDSWHHPLASIAQIFHALTPILGSTVARYIFGLGFLGASFVAALVVSLAGAWGIGEAFGFKHSLNCKFKDAKLFYLAYTVAHVGGALLVISSVNLIRLTIDVEVMNAILLPIVLGFLLALEAKALPKPWRMKGFYKYGVWTLSSIVMVFGIYMGIVAIA